MKRTLTSAGLLVAGLASLQAANNPGLTPLETSKWWNVSLALHGFYDDNVSTLPDASPGKTSTWGFSVIPSVALNFPMDMTYLGVSYTYTFRYYAEDVFSKNNDQSHELKIKLDHRFSERVRLNFTDAFAYSSEPEIIDQNISTPIRTEAAAWRNRAGLNLNVQITELLGTEIGYENTWVNYEQSGTGSRSALLDRLEHLIHGDVRYQVQETLVALAGYQFGYTDYTGNDLLYAANAANPFPPDSDFRDAVSHYLYVGAEWAAMDNVTFAAKVGAQYTDYVNADESEWSPYVDLSGTYHYLPGSFVRLGFKNMRAATDVTYNPGLAAGGTPTLDQELSIVYLSLNHAITPQLSADVTGQYQNARFDTGVADGECEDFFSVGVHVAYRFNQHWSTEAGYSYDHLDSGVTLYARDFSRNRVYFGVRATY